MKHIEINGARENNLKSISLQIPKNQFVLVTGVSGSGKSTLVQNIIANEGQRLFLKELNSRARQHFSRIKRPDVDSIRGLSPVVSLDQLSFSSNTRSTVGTLSEIYDYLRLAFARYSKSRDFLQIRPNRSLFSFNLDDGACPHCKGLGIEEFIDPDTFIINPDKSVKDGAISLTNPNGYIIYSQVTIDVLEEVCRAEGFDLNKAWNELKDREKEVILYGSNKIRIPFGKHPLESRMKWSGITAKPREEGFYRGMIPVMEEILKRDRNKNILKYTSSGKCSVCSGKRLKPEAVSFRWLGRNISSYAALTVDSLQDLFSDYMAGEKFSGGEKKIAESIIARCRTIQRLGLGHLEINRDSTSLSAGEIKRLRLSTLLQDKLSGLIYTLDEPTTGLHPADHENLLELMKEICRPGNTVIVIDHKNVGFDYADYWIELGPQAGYRGGELLVAGGIEKLIGNEGITESKSLSFLRGKLKIERKPKDFPDPEWIKAERLDRNNLKKIDVKFLGRGINVICGVSGAGKSTLLTGMLEPLLKGEKIRGSSAGIQTDFNVLKVIKIDQKAIGRNSRSNPATYIKLFDKIRDLYGSLPESRARGWDKSRFSFNNEGGRCPDCQGAGMIEIGVSYLGSVEVICDTCKGNRFTGETLEVTYKGKNIYDVLEMEVDEALEFFRGEKKIASYLQWLSKIGLGYLKLGQPSGTLSGGEAQRIKLASELVRPPKTNTVYLLDEPASGLHAYDIQILMDALGELTDKGHTLIIVEHDPDIVALADWIIELGPQGGTKGGELIFSGRAPDLMKADTPMAVAIRKNEERRKDAGKTIRRKYFPEKKSNLAELTGVTTNNLKNIDVDIPYNKITAVTGVSGSGKTSLVYDTLYNTSRYYFTQTYSTYIRSLIGGSQQGDFISAKGLLPSLAIEQKARTDNQRSTVATLSGIMSSLRLLFSRFAVDQDGRRSGMLARQFSFNDKSGACMNCSGSGRIKLADADSILSNPEKSVYDGAFTATKPAIFFTDPDGQYMATLKAVEKRKGLDFRQTLEKLPDRHLNILLYGTGEEVYEVKWDYKRKTVSGTHNFRSTWKGLLNLITEEYEKRLGTSRQTGLESSMKELQCPVCKGHRLNEEILKYKLGGRNLAEWLDSTIGSAENFISGLQGEPDEDTYSRGEIDFMNAALSQVMKTLSIFGRLEIPYLKLNRPVNSLSSGEYQRVRIAAQTGSELSGLMYLIDEPSTSLHPSNLDNLWNVLKDISSAGNTIVLVDHNPVFYGKADLIYELGPEGGKRGGKIIGVYDNESFSKHYTLIKRKPVPPGEGFSPDKLLCRLTEPGLNNLKVKKLDIPVGWTCIAGVSGSGKSSLLMELVNYLKNSSYRERIVLPQGETSRWIWHHNPLSILGVFEQLRKNFTVSVSSPSKKIRADYFRLTRKGGRCEECLGQGQRVVSLDYLGNSYSVCEKCDGTGYNTEARSLKADGYSIDQIMRMSLDELNNNKNSLWKSRAIEMAVSLGLGYLKAGQHGDSLSSGEKQRLLLVREMLSSGTEKNIFLFDEPARGLHSKDCNKFIHTVRQVVREGHSVVMIEHNPDLIMNADWVIELGPGAGDDGGQIIHEGQPASLINDKETPTAKAVRELYDRS